MFIRVDGDGTNAEVNVKGIVTVNENDSYGMYTASTSTSNLEVKVEKGATLETCGNKGYGIYGDVFAPATATFLGTGYTCDQIVFNGDGTVVEKPDCQDCT